MNEDYFSSPPPVIIERIKKLNELVETHGKKGYIEAAKVAEFYGHTVEWYRKAIQNGKVPYAFSDGSPKRETSHIDTLSFWLYVTQGKLYQPFQNFQQGGEKN